MSKCQVVTAFTAALAALATTTGCTTRCERSANGASPCADGHSFYICSGTELGDQDFVQQCSQLRPVCMPAGMDSHDCVAPDPAPCAKEVAGTGFDSGNPHMEVVDLDGDRLSDVVFGVRTGVNRMMARGDRTYAPAVAVALAEVDWCLADLDGDGKPDLLHRRADSDLLLARGAGDGSFAAPVPLRPGLRGWIGACGDLDGDGAADVATIDQRVPREQQRLVVLSSSRGFEPSQAFPSWSGEDVLEVAILPLRPGRAALLVQRRGDRSVDVYVQGSERPVGHLPSRPIGAADINRDGLTDVIVAAWDSSTVWLGDGQGGFAAGPPIPGARGVGEAVAADFDGDGRLDLELLLTIHSGEFATHVQSFRGQADGTFALTSDHYVLRHLTDARPAFTDRSGRTDMLAYSVGLPDEILILKGDCTAGR